MENAIIPNLRYPEFEGEWSKQPIGNHIDILTGYPIKSADISEDENCLPILRGINITEGYVRHSSDIDRFYCGSLDKLDKYLISEGDLVLGMDGSKVGKNVAVVSDDDSGAILIQRVARIRPLETAELAFIYHHIFSSIFHRYVDIVNTSSGIPHISQKQINEFAIHFPPTISEQQKIADFLSAVDTKIEQLTRQKELLEQYKKGVMQKLFPPPSTGSGTVGKKQHPELRFKRENGSDFPEWEVKRLGDLTSIYDGTHSTPDYKDQGIPFYSVEHVTANQFEETKFIAEEVWIKENKRVKLDRNDILMTRIGDIGTPRLLDWDVKASFYVSLALIKKSEHFLPNYLTQFIQSDYFQSDLWKRTLHVAYPKKINLGEINMTSVLLPCKEEQNIIASFLSNFDSKIQLLKYELEKAQSFKKGLLQQMFV